MKIEKISDNQIRCTLSHQDLVDREIELSELAYGSDKARELFKDMMQQAAYEFGFEANDIPLMIEAIPISRETLILVITKVDNPNEMSQKFKRFSLDDLSSISDAGDETDDEEDYDAESGTDVCETAGNASDSDKDNTGTVSHDELKLFSFSSLDDINRVAVLVSGIYNASNSIYKDSAKKRYYLLLHKDSLEPDAFNNVCNRIMEYGTKERASYITVPHLNEHCELIIEDKALQVLSTL